MAQGVHIDRMCLELFCTMPVAINSSRMCSNSRMLIQSSQCFGLASIYQNTVVLEQTLGRIVSLSTQARICVAETSCGTVGRDCVVETYCDALVQYCVVGNSQETVG